MTAPGPQTGYKMKLYRNTGTAGTPVWSLVSEIGDVNIPDLSRKTAELKRRAKEYVKALPGQISLIALEFKMLHGLGASTFSSLRTNFFAGTVEEFAVMDGDITVSGVQGLRCPFLIEQFPWQQNLEDVSDHDVRMVTGYWESPAGTEVDPSWYSVP